MTPVAETLLSHPVPRAFEDGKLLPVLRSPTERGHSPVSEMPRNSPAHEVQPMRSLSAPSMVWHVHEPQPENPRRFTSAPQKRETKSTADLIEVQPLSATELNHLGRILQGQFGRVQDDTECPSTPANGERSGKLNAATADLELNEKKKDCIHRLADSQIFVGFFMILTVFALFAPDLDLLFGTVESQYTLSLIMTVACFLFLFEILVQSFGKDGYIFRAYFWLDVIALISLLPDTWLFKAVFESNQAFVAGRSSRLARLLRIASRSSKATRLNRLTRIVRVAALMPRLGKVCAKRVKVNDTNRVLDKKLRRVFNFIDTDMDGLVPRMALISVLAKLKAGEASDDSTVVNIMKSKVVSTLGAMRRLTKAQRSEPHSEGTRSKCSLADFAPESPTVSQASFAGAHDSPRDRESRPESAHTSPRRKSPMSRSHTTALQAKMKAVALATSTASQLTRQTPEEDESDEVIDFQEFRRLMLEDEWVASKLRLACEEQLKEASNMKNLTSKHAEQVAVKVALGVLLLLFVLNLIEPSLKNSSPLRGLRFCDQLVRAEYPNVTDTAPVPSLVKEQVEVWLEAVQKSIGTSSLLYLDLDKKVYCSEIPEHGGDSCTNSSYFSGTRRELYALDDDLITTGYRQADMLLLRVPDFSSADVSPEELENKTTAVAVLFDRAHTSLEAWMSLLTTVCVILIILSGIVMLTRDLTFLSHHLLRPLRDLSDEMESIAQLQLAGVSTDGEEAVGQEETSEVLLIRRTFGNMKKAVRSWGKYVPWPVVQLLLRAGDEAKLEVKDREVTMFFSDIANFTTIVESIAPESCLLLLSRYFNDMSKVIDDHGGVVLEFIGDAIQCIYGAPLHNEHHPTSAVEAALKMLGALRRIKEWCQDKGLPEVSIRCGIHTGRVLVGNMGFHSRMKYGIVGEESTIAAKLEEANKTYKTRILISERTYEKMAPNDLFIRPVDYVHLRQAQGNHSELIYEVMPMRTKRPSLVNRIISLHAEAMFDYRRHEFSSAARKFEQVNAILADVNDGEDVPSSLMVKRCGTLGEVPPPSDWDGTWDAYVDSLGVNG
ncbi:unnamed protein product [Effrenium voratum]|nr:unnamed protein product [Effrenium voratum]|mmetsp:Transcript_112956/g.269197  ORF Transcript_112956/g.269197 Transcript_112956/m.269197 type:complete len:1061 (-) Transcript_112956:97-3279(-)